MEQVRELNTITWYVDRRLSYCPLHFVKASTKLNFEAAAWVYEKLYGRFYVSPPAFDGPTIYFEDPQEAIYYELVWS